jgi:hypothetical protein
MTDFNDDFEDADESEAKLAHELRTKGAWIAYRTNVAMCEDPKASASAKAQAAASLFRAAGLFGSHALDDREKDLFEMTPAELKAALRKAETSLKNREDEINKPKGGLFD